MFKLYYCEIINQDFSEKLKTLNVDENVLAHIFKYKNEKRRLQSSIGAILAQTELAKLGANLSYLPNGKPVSSDERIFVSIAHSGNYVFCAISDREVGVDAEPFDLDSKHDNIIKRFPVEERKLLADKKISFSQLWTSKEAYAKMCNKSILGVIKECIYDKNSEACNGIFEFKNINGFIVCICEKII